MSVLMEQAGSQMGRVGGRFSLFALTRRMHEVLTCRHSRKALARLVPHQPDDIGVSLEQALAEAAKPWWTR